MKKITYLVVSLLLMGTTPMLTGCVDTDEPAGIEELRGAKSELLRAKAAVEQAKVAVEQANAAYKNAEAELMKAKAAYKNALAAQVNAETEADKAAAEQALEAARQAAEQAAKMWEIQYKTAEAQYQAMLVQLAVQQSAQIDQALADYKSAVKSAKSEMESKAKALREAQRDYNKALADLEEDEAKKELNTRELNKKVILAERAKEGAELAVTEAEEAYEEAQNMKLADVAVKRDELKEEIAKLDEEVFNLKIAAAENKYKLQQTEGEALRQHKKDAKAMLEEEIEIPAFSLKLNGALPNGEQGSYDAEATVYALNNLSDYTTRKNSLEALKSKVESWVRDEDGNDDLWTAERIAKMEADIESTEENLEKVKTLWKEAVAAYNTNKADVADPTQITGYAELKEAVGDYNAAATAWNAVNKKILDANDAKKKAQETYDEAIKKIAEDLEKAKNNAQTTWEKTDEAIPEQAKTQAAQLQKTLEETEKAYNEAVENFNKNTDPEKVTELYLEQVKAELAYAEAQEAWMSEADLIDELNKQNDKTYGDAVLKAEGDAEKAEGEAKKTRDEVVKAQDEIIAGLEKEEETAAKTLDETVAAIVDEGKAFDVFYANASSTTINTKALVTAARYAVDDKGNPVAEEVDIEELTELDKARLTYVINSLSNSLYGTYIYDTNAYGDFEARLKEISDETIKKYAEEALTKEEIIVGENGNIASNIVSLSEYTSQYDRYGMAGRLLSSKELVELAKKWIDNDDDVMAMVETVNTALDELVATYEAAEEAYEAEQEAIADEEEAYDAKIAELNLPVDEAEAKNEPLTELYQSYVNLIDEYTKKDGVDGNLFDEEALKAYVEGCKEAVTKAEDALYDAETALMQAKQNLADYESGKKSAFDLAAENLEEAQTAYNIAQENYNAALTELNNKIAELSAITAQ